MSRKYQPKYTDGVLNPLHKPDDRKRAKKKSNDYIEHDKPVFVALDGEGWNGKYTLLQSSMGNSTYNRNGLPTLQILDFLHSRDFRQANLTLVIYGGNYDFENWLIDIPDEDYKRLTRGETITFDHYKIQYIPRKFLTFSYEYNGKKYTRFVQDVFSFFGTSFLSALDTWNIDIPPIIREGKANRNNFNERNISKIKLYCFTELYCLVELMDALAAADAAAFKAINIRDGQGPRGWFGPGARASRLLDATCFKANHPALTLPDAPNNMPTLKGKHPFAIAYYGGRVETATIGEIPGPIYDYDLNSAYPYAIAQLPKWNSDDLIYINGFDPLDRPGIYFVNYHAKKENNFYGLPYRKNDSICYPRITTGWYMSPEINAILDTYPEDIEIIGGYVLANNTPFQGSGITGGVDVCTTAQKIKQLADLRLTAKANGDKTAKAYKLLINSVYGKLIQQVGNHKFLDLFCAAWITSTCRAIIYRAIAHNEDAVISIITDGILTTRPLNVDLGEKLGQFQVAEYEKAIQILPGVYSLIKDNKIIVKRFMAASGGPDPAAALTYLRSGKPLPINTRIFVTRNMSLIQNEVYGEKALTFVNVTKYVNFDLSSKRDGLGPMHDKFYLGEGEINHTFKPKLTSLSNMIPSSVFKMVLDDSKVNPHTEYPEMEKIDYDTAETIDEMLTDGFISMINDEKSMR